MKYNFFTLLVVLFSVSTMYAEKIEGPAFIRSQAQGVVLFTLNDNVEVSCSDLDYGWYQVGVFITVSDEEFERKTIYRGQSIIDSTGKVIGKAQENCQIITEHELIKVKNRALLKGYAYKSNIRTRSVPEIFLSEFVTRYKSDSLSLKLFELYFKENKFISKNILKDEKYQEFFILESWVYDEIPTDRIRFIFENGLLAAIVHKRDFTIQGYETLELLKNRKITFINAKDSGNQFLLKKKNNALYQGIY
ncbi:MAG: hypothetical protein IPO21_08495 [Bacteroidales bacterium]|nr:hypothetical protein [Bacteroidales bacterium]